MSDFEGFENGAITELLVNGVGHEAVFSGGLISEPEYFEGVYEKAWYVPSLGESSSGIGNVTLNPGGILVEFDYQADGNIQVVIQLLDSGQSVVHEHTIADEKGKFSYRVAEGDSMIESLSIKVVGGDGGMYIDNFHYFGTSISEPCNDVISVRAGGSIGFLILLVFVLVVGREYLHKLAHDIHYSAPIVKDTSARETT
jgi:hypothetical protein